MHKNYVIRAIQTREVICDITAESEEEAKATIEKMLHQGAISTNKLIDEDFETVKIYKIF
jgi:predicted lactoylglutathione lyase